MMTKFEADTPQREVIDMGNNKLYIERKGQYGHVFLHLDKGHLPEHLQGAYTSFGNARAAAELYLKTRKTR